MKTLVMNMSSGTVERIDERETGYSDEVLRAGWNPAVNLVRLVPESKKEMMPAELATVDAETFLKKMVALQR